jgi:FtsZ-binding cell division protein ZapB
MGNGFFDLAEESRPVDTQSFDALEVKIMEVLDRLKVLQDEKAELQKQVQSLQERYDDAARQVAELSQEREVLKRNQRDTEAEELIRSKISTLLAKLESA